MITVRLARRAQRYYERLDAETAARLDRALARLAENPFQGDIRRLQGLEGRYRLRVGDLRVIFRLDLAAQTIDVSVIAPRGQAYR